MTEQELEAVRQQCEVLKQQLELSQQMVEQLTLQNEDLTKKNEDLNFKVQVLESQSTQVQQNVEDNGTTLKLIMETIMDNHNELKQQLDIEEEGLRKFVDQLMGSDSDEVTPMSQESTQETETNFENQKSTSQEAVDTNYDYEKVSFFKKMSPEDQELYRKQQQIQQFEDFDMDEKERGFSITSSLSRSSQDF